MFIIGETPINELTICFLWYGLIHALKILHKELRKYI
jgi:hypothetical protein